ncbi:MAG: DUF1194 domain-containing protein [Hyphomicrobiaceae bacterium]
MHRSARRHWDAVRRPLRRVAIAFAAGTIVMCLGLISSSGRTSTSVDLVLVLALDVSGSVDNNEFHLQRGGLAAAFKDHRVVEAISRGLRKRIAVAAVQWAGLEKQAVVVPWTIVNDAESAARFSDSVTKMDRSYQNSETHISGVINFGTDLIKIAPVTAERRVIDISGDGMDNVGYSPHRARNRALRFGVTINGLAILNETPRLQEYYHHNVIGGPDAFVIKANRYEDYADAILRKLIREIDGHLLS